jgi:L-alanine-DL-glutamate epimerase-like enolase superfamily enzyme
MKIWPFDQFVAKTNGQYISLEDLDQGLEPFRKIRQAVGEKMEIMVELHSLWNLPSAIRIAKALEEFKPMWYEDPVRMDNLDALSEFKASTSIPTCASETVATRWAFREMLERHAVSIVMLDVAWVGGLSEARKIATMAEAHHLPFAPHDCTGPVTLMASVHLCMHGPNALIQETVRAFNHGWYPRLVTTLPRIENGYVYAPEAAGLGMALRPEVLERDDLTVRTSDLA